jgi:hypothetical protein
MFKGGTATVTFTIYCFSGAYNLLKILSCYSGPFQPTPCLVVYNNGNVLYLCYKKQEGAFVRLHWLIMGYWHDLYEGEGQEISLQIIGLFFHVS